MLVRRELGPALQQREREVLLDVLDAFTVNERSKADVLSVARSDALTPTRPDVGVSTGRADAGLAGVAVMQDVDALDVFERDPPGGALLLVRDGTTLARCRTVSLTTRPPSLRARAKPRRRFLSRVSGLVKRGRIPAMNLLRRSVAEAIGTFALVFAGCGAIMVEAETDALGQGGIAATFGLTVMAMILAVEHISGAHFNPAVSFAFMLTRHLPVVEMAAFWVAQVAGGLLAAVVLRASLGDVAKLGTTLPDGSTGQAFVWEVVLTFFLMFVIMSVATDDRAVGANAAIAIGGTVALDAMFGGPITGASMNPARSFAPAVVSGDLSHLWLYLTALLVGAALGALAYQFVRGEHPEVGGLTT